MILIADCGGTKVNWCLLDQDIVKCDFSTPGMNALMLPYDEMCSRIAAEVVPPLGSFVNEVSQIYFYGAGCVSKAICDSVASALRSHFANAEVEVVSDLLGTCRALCADRPGIVCILGTGSNSCLYDGERIIENTPSLGFIVGDEGGGAYLGKMLAGDVFKRQLPPDLCEMFRSRFQLDALALVQRVYREPYPNKFLASLTPFLSEHIDRPEIRDIVIRGFRAFFKRNICLYSGSPYASSEVQCCGSIAAAFKDILAEAAAWYGFTLGDVVRNPLNGLIRYHSPH